MKYCGKLEGCELYNTICNYICCCQDNDTSFSIMMYPGEYENTTLPKDHIHVIGENYGATIGKCMYSIEERKKCDGIERFKPLDCFSYPFFPTIKNGRLQLLVDKTRCPLPVCCNLDNHYNNVYNIWNELIKNRRIYNCISRIHIDYFEEYKNKSR